jgi:exocyst complex component 2
MKVLIIRKSLHNKVREMPQGVEQQKKLVKALINLEIQQLGSSVANKLSIGDPAWDAIEARAKYLDNTFKQTFEQYLAKEGQQSGTKAARGDSSQVPNRVLFCEEMTEIAASQFPDLWRLGQAYFTGELRGVNEPKPGNFKVNIIDFDEIPSNHIHHFSLQRIILTSIERFCSCLRAALIPSAAQKSNLALSSFGGLQPWPATTASINQFISWLPNCLRYARVSYASLIRLDLPNEALDIVLKLIDELRLYCLSTIFKKANDKIKKIADRETWEILVTDFPGATLLVSLVN